MKIKRNNLKGNWNQQCTHTHTHKVLIEKRVGRTPNSSCRVEVKGFCLCVFGRLQLAQSVGATDPGQPKVLGGQTKPSLLLHLPRTPYHQQGLEGAVPEVAGPHCYSPLMIL